LGYIDPKVCKKTLAVVAPTVESSEAQKNHRITGERAGERETEMHEMNSIVAVYETPADALDGVNHLQKAGFDMMRVSVVAREYQNQEHVVGYCSTGGASARCWGKLSGFYGEVGGSLAGVAFFVLPGLGPVLLAGPLVNAVVSSIDEAPTHRGFGALDTALRRLGIPGENILRYESELCADRFLVLAHWTQEELMQAREILHKSRPSELNLHFTAETTAVARRRH